jgi:hypothetical protein
MNDLPELARRRARARAFRPPSLPSGVIRTSPMATLLLLLFALVPAALHGQEEEDRSEEALFLLLPVSAKAVGLGRAMTAMPGPESSWWNPAGLASVQGGRVLVYRGDHPLAGPATALSLLLTHRLGALATSYQLIDLGSQDVTDLEGTVIGTLTSRNHLGILSLASRFRNLISVGANLKIVRFQFTCRGLCEGAGVSDTWLALDAGLQLTNVAGTPLTLAGQLANGGSNVGSDSEAGPLPTRVRAAAAYEVLGHFVATDELSLTLTTEVEDRWRNPGSPATYLGAEFTAGRLDAGAGRRDALHVRAGYVFGAEQQLDGASVGVGLQYGRFDMALAKSLASSPFPGASEPIHISFGYIF